MKVCESVEQPQSSTRPDFSINLTQLYINGEWRDSASGKTFAAIDPTTEAEIAQLAEGTVDDVELAVQSAAIAFAGDWSQMSGHERGEILWRVGDLFRQHGEELAFLQAKEVGRLFKDSMTVDIPHRQYVSLLCRLGEQTRRCCQTSHEGTAYLYAARTIRCGRCHYAL